MAVRSRSLRLGVAFVAVAATVAASTSPPAGAPPFACSTGSVYGTAPGTKIDERATLGDTTAELTGTASDAWAQPCRRRLVRRHAPAPRRRTGRRRGALDGVHPPSVGGPLGVIAGWAGDECLLDPTKQATAMWSTLEQ